MSNIHNTLDNILNNYNTSVHSTSPKNIANIKNDSSNTLNNIHIYRNINHDNKIFTHSASEINNSKYNDILNIWNFQKIQSINDSNDNINSINIIDDFKNYDENINNNNNNNSNNNNTSNNNNLNIKHKKKNEYYHLNNKNIKLKSITNIKNNDINNNINNNSNKDNDIESLSHPYKEKLYIKPYICEKQYRKNFDRCNSTISSYGRSRNRNRNIEIDASLFNGNPCIPESLKLRLEREKTKGSFDKIYFNNPNDIFKKNSALIDAIEEEKKLNKNIEKKLIKSNDLLLGTEEDESITEQETIPNANTQNEKYRKTFDKEKFKKANNRYF